MRLLVVLFLLLSLLQSHQATPGDEIARAEAAYKEGNYAEAIQLYDSLVDAGYRDGALYYDLGSAYYQLGDLGRGLLNYLRAQKSMPRDGELSEKIALIRASRLDFQPVGSGLWADLSGLTASWTTTQELFWLLWFLWSVGCVLFSLWLLWPQVRQRLRLPLMLCGVTVFIGLMLLGIRLLLGATRPAAVVVEDKVAVMSGPGEHYLHLFDVHASAEVRIVEAQGSWVWMELPDDRQGWILATALDWVER